MDEERELGRIAGLRTRRRKAATWAEGFVGLLADARKTLQEYADTGEPSRQAYADWLNAEGIPTRRRKGRWRSQQVHRLFDTHIGLIDEAEREFDIEMGIIRFKWKHADEEARTGLANREKAARENRAVQINDANRLSADLRGLPYTDQAVPDRLAPVTQPRKPKKPKPDLPDEPEEEQLSLL